MWVSVYFKCMHMEFDFAFMFSKERTIIHFTIAFFKKFLVYLLCICFSFKIVTPYFDMLFCC